MLLTRVLTALVGIPIILGAAYAGGWWWDGLVLLLTVLAIFEVLSMAGISDVLTRVSCYAGGLVLLLSLSGLFSLDWRGACFAVVLILAIASVVRFPVSLSGNHLLATAASLYVGFLMGFALAINHQHAAPFFSLVCVMLLTWASDTGAYFAGSYLGKHHLAPALSPNKTWEGAVGGALLTVVVAAVLLFKGLGWESLLFGLAASVLAQSGDLLESGIKRAFGAKDSGFVLPGHGGVFDRFDSMLLVLPLVFFALM